MVLRVNDPDKLYPQGTMQAARDAEKRFRAPVSKPAPTPTQQIQNTAPGLGPQRVTSRVQVAPQTDFITRDTNPKMDWRTAAAINEARAKGYESRLGAVQSAQAGLDEAFQSGQNTMAVTRQAGRNQLATTALDNQGAMARTVRQGTDAKERLGITNQFTSDEARKAHSRELERLGITNTYDQESANRKFAADYILGGGNPATIGNVMNAGEFAPSLGGIEPIPKNTKSDYKFEPGKFTTMPDGTRNYTQLPTVSVGGQTRIAYEHMSEKEAVADLVSKGYPEDLARDFYRNLLNQ